MIRYHRQSGAGSAWAYIWTEFLPARRYASAGTIHGPVSVSVSVCLSVTSRCSIKMDKRIELVFGMEVSFDQSYAVF